MNELYLATSQDPDSECLGDAEYKLAEVLAPIALLADSASFYASVPQVDHAVIGEAADEPGDVQDVALRSVVRVSNDCLVVVGHLAPSMLAVCNTDRG